MIRPSVEEILGIAKEGIYKTVPVSMEILSDIKTPIQVLKTLKNVSNHCYMLESVAESERWGRYTFLGFDPKLEISCTNGEMKVGSLTFQTTDPSHYIRQVLAEYKSPSFDYLPSFTGGLVGYFSYDYLKYAEPTLQLDGKDTEKFKDVDLMIFDKVIAFDNFRQKIVLIVNMQLDNPEVNYNKARMEVMQLSQLIKAGKQKQDPIGKLTSYITPLFGKESFCEMVEKGKEFIREGDIFQIVLSNRLEATYEGSLLNTYRVLRTLNPSPYMFYFSSSDMEVAGASPETLVKLEDGVLHTFPLAGTRPRGRTDEEYRELELSLLADPKELAEHNMLVDLGRNDLGRISEFGSVVVNNMHSIEKFSHVMHIGSTVQGKLREDCDALDAINAILPAGTLSGAPKICACQIIDDLEDNKRGIYGGQSGTSILVGISTLALPFESLIRKMVACSSEVALESWRIQCPRLSMRNASIKQWRLLQH